MTLTKDRCEQVANIVGDTLAERYTGKFVFEPIVVVPATSVYGDDYLRIFIVFDGDMAQFDTSWDVEMIGLLRTKLEAIDIGEFPSPRYIEKSEWLDPELYDGGKRGVYLGGY